MDRLVMNLLYEYPVEILEQVFSYLQAAEVGSFVLDPLLGQFAFDLIYKQVHTGKSPTAPFSVDKQGRLSYIACTDLERFMKDDRLRNMHRKTLRFYDVGSMLEVSSSAPEILRKFGHLVCGQTLSLPDVRKLSHLTNLDTINIKYEGMQCRKLDLPTNLATLHASDATIEESFPETLKELYLSKPRTISSASFPGFPSGLKKLRLFSVPQEWELTSKFPLALEKLFIDPLGLRDDDNVLQLSSFTQLKHFTSFNRDWYQLSLPKSLTELNLTNKSLSNFDELKHFCKLKNLSINCDNLQDLNFPFPPQLQKLAIADTYYHGDGMDVRESITLNLRLPDNLKILIFCKLSERKVFLHENMELPRSLVQFTLDGMTPAAAQLDFPESLEQLKIGRVGINLIHHSNLQSLGKLSRLHIYSAEITNMDLSRTNIKELLLNGQKSEISLLFPPHLEKLHLQSIFLTEMDLGFPSSLKELKSSFGRFENKWLFDLPKLETLSVLNQVTQHEGPPKIRSIHSEFYRISNSLPEHDKRLKALLELIGSVFDTVDFATVPTNLKTLVVSGTDTNFMNIHNWDKIVRRVEWLAAPSLVFGRFATSMVTGITSYQFHLLGDTVDVSMSGDEVVVHRRGVRNCFKV